MHSPPSSDDANACVNKTFLTTNHTNRHEIFLGFVALTDEIAREFTV